MARILSYSYFADCFGVTFLLTVILLWCQVESFYLDGNCSLCEVPKHHGHKETLEKLKPLCGLRFSTLDEGGNYEYNIGICSVAEIAESESSLKNAGAIQIDLKKNNLKKMIGSLVKTEVMSGRNWISLEYEGGDTYGSHCESEERRTIVMITCSPGVTKGNLRWLEENRNKSGDCYYLFELEHDSACNLVSQDDIAGLSPGSIVCVVLGTLSAAYLLFGFLYMRFVKGAKGVYQIPNYAFWQDFGNLQADGCDLICRCTGNRHQDIKAPYHGIGDHQIESANDGEDLDEHLLPM